MLNQKERDQLIMQYGPLVKSVVGRMSYKLPIDAADCEDLYNVGIIGLMEALDKYDKKRNVQFETYARFRIRGAVLDELRARDWVPRSVRHKDSKLEAALAAVKKILGRRPDEQEVADYLGITLEQYFKLLDDTKGVPVISQEDLTPDYLETHGGAEVAEAVQSGNPFDLLAGNQTRALLNRAIDELPEKEKLVMSLYYNDEMTMKEIGRILDLTESRVCQLHTQAILRLRGGLKNSLQ
jgi:RNA polymerase sigma factor for flagellar operon FliA